MSDAYREMSENVSVIPFRSKKSTAILRSSLRLGTSAVHRPWIREGQAEETASHTN
jgi:hypothetical protein